MKGKVFPLYMKQRVFTKNQNLLILTCGDTGSGKSYSNLKLAEDYYKVAGKGSFPIENVCFTPKEFLELLNSGTLRRGDIIIFEELGISQSSRSWYSQMNKMINFILQSFRHMNLIVLMNTPDASFVDSHTRKLLHFIFECVGIDFDKKVCSVKPLICQTNKRSGKVYMKYLRVRIKGQVVRLERLKFGLPSKKLIEAYEEKKQMFTENLNQEIYEDILSNEKKNKRVVGSCLKCKHKWVIRAKKLPYRCPSCQTRKWNTRGSGGSNSKNG